MKEIKRHLMDGYVQFTDGTYGVMLHMEQFVEIASGKGEHEFYIDGDDNIFMMVHEDEASAHEPELYIEDFDFDLEFEDLTPLSEAIAKFYDMYTDDDTPFMLNINVLNAEEVLEDIYKYGGQEKYTEYREALMRDIASDMEFFGEQIKLHNSTFAKDIMNELSQAYIDVYRMGE